MPATVNETQKIHARRAIHHGEQADLAALRGRALEEMRNAVMELMDDGDCDCARCECMKTEAIRLAEMAEQAYEVEASERLLAVSAWGHFERTATP